MKMSRSLRLLPPFLFISMHAVTAEKAPVFFVGVVEEGVVIPLARQKKGSWDFVTSRQEGETVPAGIQKRFPAESLWKAFPAMGPQTFSPGGWKLGGRYGGMPGFDPRPSLPLKPRNDTPGYFAVTPPEGDAAGFVPVEDESAVRPAVEPYMRAQLDLWKKKARAAEKECVVSLTPESDWKRECWSFRAAMPSGDIYLWSHCVEPVGRSSVEGTFLVAQKKGAGLELVSSKGSVGACYGAEGPSDARSALPIGLARSGEGVSLVTASYGYEDLRYCIGPAKGGKEDCLEAGGL